MRARWRLLEAARELKPLRQGELDGLCGLYSIINAIRLAVYPRRLPKPELQSLFKAGLRELTKTRRLCQALTDGMGDALWEGMVERVLVQAQRDLGRTLLVEDLLTRPRVQSTANAHKTIRHALRSGLPTIITLTRSYDHWTVISGATQARYRLFDSWGYQWVGTANVVLEETNEDGTHGLTRALALRSDS